MMIRSAALMIALAVGFNGPAFAQGDTANSAPSLCDAIPADAASEAMGLTVTEAKLGLTGASEYCDYTFVTEGDLTTNVFIRRLDPAVEFVGDDAAAAFTARAGMLGAAPKQAVEIGDQAIVFRGNFTLTGLLRLGDDIYTIESIPEYLTDEALTGLMQATADALGDAPNEEAAAEPAAAAD